MSPALFLIAAMNFNSRSSCKILNLARTPFPFIFEACRSHISHSQSTWDRCLYLVLDEEYLHCSCWNNGRSETNRQQLHYLLIPTHLHQCVDQYLIACICFMTYEWTVWSKNIQSPINNIIFEMRYFTNTLSAWITTMKDPTSCHLSDT